MMNSVVVAYATPERQVELQVVMDVPCTVKEVIQRSGVLQQFPDIDLQVQPVGIHSRKVSLEAQVEAGQRVEIYRPLTIDPNQARLLRAARRRE